MVKKVAAKVAGAAGWQGGRTCKRVAGWVVPDQEERQEQAKDAVEGGEPRGKGYIYSGSVYPLQEV